MASSTRLTKVKELPALPVVTVVVPMLNEVGYIEACLSEFERQSYPLEKLDVVVVDGGSDDGSRELVDKLATERPWLRVVDNPQKKAAAAFNVGTREARGDVVCLFSAHGVADRDYVASSVRVLRETGADGVGGRYSHVGTDRASNAIGLAMVSPFGMASPHRFAHERQAVDTISHPAYVRDSLVAAGRFDESLERNSDYELNYRMRELGMQLLFDPAIESIYRPRRSLAALGRQFWWYGRWKARVIARHPGSLKLRHLAAPTMVVGLAVSPLLGCSKTGRRVDVAVAAAYVLATTGAVASARPADHDASPLVLAVCFPVMHTCWGAGFVASVIQDGLKRFRRPSRSLAVIDD